MKYAHVVKKTPKKSLVVAIQMPVSAQTAVFAVIVAKMQIVAELT